MRSALLLSGNPRFCKDFDSQLDNLKNSLIDWIVVLWDRGNSEDTKISPEWKAKTAEEVAARLEPNLPPGHRLAHVELVDPQSCPPSPREYTGFYCNAQAVWQQYQILKLCDYRRREAEAANQQPYDLVIRSRPDIGLANLIDLENEKNYLLENPNILLTPKQNVALGRTPMSDYFVVGLPDAMSIFNNAVDYFDEFHSNNIPYSPELLLKAILTTSGISLPPTEIEGIIRKSGVHVPSIFYPEFGRWL